jgi:hypothetical protein
MQSAFDVIKLVCLINTPESSLSGAEFGRIWCLASVLPVVATVRLAVHFNDPASVLRGPYTYESGSRVRLGSGSSEPNSPVCESPRSSGCGDINPRRPREPDSYVCGPPL